MAVRMEKDRQRERETKNHYSLSQNWNLSVTYQANKPWLNIVFFLWACFKITGMIAACRPTKDFVEPTFHLILSPIKLLVWMTHYTGSFGFLFWISISPDTISVRLPGCYKVCLCIVLFSTRCLLRKIIF